MAIDISGILAPRFDNIQLWQRNGLGVQNLMFLADGTISRVTHSNKKAIGIQDCGRRNEFNISLQDKNGLWNQQWEVIDVWE